MNRTNHKIAEQSKKWLSEALIRLMKDHDYNNITVTQICQKADLSRRTYYRLFQTRDDVLNQYLFMLADEYIAVVNENAIDGHYRDIVLSYYRFWLAHKDLLLLLKKNNLLTNIFVVTESLAPVVFHMVKKNLQTPLDDEMLGYALAYSLGGLNRMLIEWIHQDLKLPPQELANILDMAIQTAML